MLRLTAGRNDCEVFSSEGDTPSPSFPVSGTIAGEAIERVGGWGRLLWSCVLRAWTHCDDSYLTRPQIHQKWDFETEFSLLFQAGFQLECNTTPGFIPVLKSCFCLKNKLCKINYSCLSLYILHWTVLLQWIFFWISLYINSISK